MELVKDMESFDRYLLSSLPSGDIATVEVYGVEERDEKRVKTITRKKENHNSEKRSDSRELLTIIYEIILNRHSSLFNLFGPLVRNF